MYQVVFIDAIQHAADRPDGYRGFEWGVAGAVSGPICPSCRTNCDSGCGGADAVAGGENIDRDADRGVEQLVIGFWYSEHANPATHRGRFH